MATKSVLGGDYSLDERTDDDLVELARSGGSRTGAWDELYRRHASSARGVARHIMGSREDADDVVNDAFAGMIAAIGRGAGPRTNFRHYLMACVRNGCKSRSWRSGASVSTDPSVLEQRHGAVFEDAERFGEAGLVASAFSSLSTDWQRALWMTAVEERPTEDVARELGRRPAAVAALAHRAREAFAEAYLSQHQQRVTAPSCERSFPKLAHYVRGRAGEVDTARVEHHLSRCAECSRTVAELRDVNSSLRSLVLPTSLIGTSALTAAAPIVGIGSAVGFAGWGATVFGGAVFAKVAVLAALVVPAALIATDTERPQRTIRETAIAADAGAGAFDLGSQTEADIPRTANGDAQPLAPVVPGADPGPEATSENATEIVSVGAPVADARHEANQPPPTVAIPAVIASISTTPISTTPISTPSNSTPAIVIPEIETELITVPSVTVPSLTVPSLTVQSITIPAVVVPSITIAPIADLPAIVLPESSLPPIQLLSLTELLGL